MLIAAVEAVAKGINCAVPSYCKNDDIGYRDGKLPSSSENHGHLQAQYLSPCQRLFGTLNELAITTRWTAVATLIFLLPSTLACLSLFLPWGKIIANGAPLYAPITTLPQLRLLCVQVAVKAYISCVNFCALSGLTQMCKLELCIWWSETLGNDNHTTVLGGMPCLQALALYLGWQSNAFQPLHVTGTSCLLLRCLEVQRAYCLKKELDDALDTLLMFPQLERL